MKAIMMALLALTLGVSGVFAAGPLGDDSGTDRTIPVATSSNSSTTTGTVEDIPGPCDEPEHANDPRCAGGATTRGGTTTTETRGGTTTTETRGRDNREAGEDVRGPCDEAEHANDPRCTGGAAGDDDRRGGNSGPGGSDDSGSDDSGSGSSGRGGSDDDDRSGSNSGPS